MTRRTLALVAACPGPSWRRARGRRAARERLAAVREIGRRRCRRILAAAQPTRARRSRAIGPAWHAAPFCRADESTCRYAVPGPVGCALEIANRGAMTLEDVGALYGITREGVRQWERGAMRRSRVVRLLRGLGVLGAADVAFAVAVGREPAC